MDFFDSENQMEKYLRNKCASSLMPFSGGIELTPECNMDCKFCYVHQNHIERKKTGELLSAEQWCHIVDQAFDMGVYSLLITGGEPLLHPEFRKIYAYISNKGIPVVLNSNGTLMHEDDVAFLRQNGCRRVNISLYGSDNDTYEKLCGLHNGFDKVMHTLQILKDNQMTVRISVSLTPQNIGQIDAISQIAESFDFPVQFTSYMFPASRRGISAEEQYRLSPEEAAEATVRCFHLKNPQADYEASCRYSLSKMVEPTKYKYNDSGFMCYAGKSDFWISWNGEMRPCGMFDERNLAYSLLEYTFEECWMNMTAACVASATVCEECRGCSKQDLCQVCPAASFAEAGKMTGKPEYLCRLTDGIVNICREAVAEAVSQKPLVSIIVPVYNVREYLPHCVESFLRQKLSSWELILVDDGSSDGSGDMCDQYAEQDSRISVIHQMNQGVSAARNRGLEAAAADYIAFCDSDDFVENDFCRILYHAIKNREDTFITANTWTGDDNRPRTFIIGDEYTDSNHISIEEAKQNVLYCYVWNKIYSREIIREHNLKFDESCSYGEDLKFNEEYIKYCKDAAFIREPLCVHLCHENGLAMQGLRRSGTADEEVELDGFAVLRRFESQYSSRDGIDTKRIIIK